MMRIWAVGAVLVLSIVPARAGLFDVPEPTLIYAGTAPGAESGVLVLRDEASFRSAATALDPDFAHEGVDLTKRTALRIVGRARDNACRETKLVSVSTRNITATVELQETVPSPGCQCKEDSRPPAAWLVAVTRMVKRANLQVTDIVVPCPQAEAAAARVEEKPVLLLESSWDHAPGAEIVRDATSYQGVLAKLGVGARAGEVDFKQHHVVVVTGRGRENGCRRTGVITTALTGLGAPEATAEFAVEEVYAQTGQKCIQVYSLPKAFVYRVPAGVSKAKVTTSERR